MAARKSMAKGALRVLGFVLVLVGASWAFWSWRGAPPPPALSLGAALSAHAPPEGGGEVLVINGVRVRTESVRLDQDLDAAIARLRTACAVADDGLDEALRVARGERVAAVTAGAAVERAGDRAMVTCNPVDGRERFFYAEASEEGAGVVVRALESSAPLPLIGAGAAEDAPGRDLSNVPRPSDSTRLLSSFTPDYRYGMVQLALPPGELAAQRDAYAGRLEAAGFEVSAPLGDDPHLETLIAERGPRRVIVVLDDEAGDGTIVTLLDQG